jgi:hypothetical protein
VNNWRVFNNGGGGCEVEKWGFPRVFHGSSTTFPPMFHFRVYVDNRKLELGVRLPVGFSVVLKSRNLRVIARKVNIMIIIGRGMA